MSKGLYTQIVSVGDNCFWGMYLRDNGLREAAFPFDFMFGSLPFVTECIRTSGGPLLDMVARQDSNAAKWYPDEPFPAPSTPHHRMTDADGRGHYTRALERLLQIDPSKDRVLFTHIRGDFVSRDEAALSLFIGSVQEAYPGLQFAVLSLIYAGQLQAPDVAATSGTVTCQTERSHLIVATIHADEVPDSTNWYQRRNCPSIDSLMRFVLGLEPDPQSPVSVRVRHD